jgi:hypothetical protein
LAGSKGGNVGSGPLSAIGMEGIFNGSKGGAELANVEFTLEPSIEPSDEGTVDWIDCAKTLAAKAVANKAVIRPNVIIFLIVLHLFFKSVF